MRKDPKRLSVEENSGYSSLTDGPVQDTDVLATQGVHDDAQAPAAFQQPRNQAAPNPMAELRQSARQGRGGARSSGGSSTNLVYAVIGTAGVLFFVGVVAIVLATSSQPEAEPVQELEVHAPAEGTAERPAPAKEAELTEIDGVPVRKGLRGQ